MVAKILLPFNNKLMFYRVIIIAFIIVAPFSVTRAQQETVADLIPHALGNFVDYNEYDTASAGGPAAKSHASYTINGYDNATAVISVLDSIGGGDPSGIHQLHYYFLTSDDLQIYADTAFIAAFIPSNIAAGVTSAPNTWVDYFKLSAGLNTSYPVTVLNSNITESGIPATVTVTLSGEYKGIDTVTASGLTYDSAYRFDLQALVNISVAGGLAKGSFTSVQSDWLVRGIGVIKTNAPIAGTTIDNKPTSTDGRETEMTSYGNTGTASVAPVQKQISSISFYPDPASEQVTLTFNRPANQIFLYNDAGQMIRSFELSSSTNNALLWVQDIPNGAYHAQVIFDDGTSQTTEIVIRH